MNQTLNLLNTIIKTILTLLLALVVAFLVALFGIGLFSGTSASAGFGIFVLIISVAAGARVFWELCPADTKTWFKDWTKPSNPKKTK